MEHEQQREPNNKPLTIIQLKHVLGVYHRDSDKSAVKVHPFFEDLAFNTVKNYRHSAKILHETLDELYPLEYGAQTEQFSPGHAQSIVDSIIADRGPGAARCAVASMGSILAYMILYTRISTSTYNAFDYVKIPKGEMIGAWTKEQISEHISADVREGTFMKVLVMLLYETGQRLSDAIDISSDSIKTDGNGNRYLSVCQKKTGKNVIIPLSHDLSRTLGYVKQYIAPTESRKFLSCFVMPPYNENSVRYFYKKECDRLGIQPLPLHGLRKSAVIRMIEAGATVFEVMSVTGHKSVSSLKHYMDGYSQMESARRAFEKAGMA